VFTPSQLENPTCPASRSFHQVNLVVRDMSATLSFYRRLGWSIATPTAEHAAAELPNGIRVEFGSVDFVRVWDSGDAFCGSRYAIVDDPDGNPLGLMSPSDDAKRFWPPREPPLRDSEPTTGSP
jgi:catechol 2,3-dioxygenase-like lactoylglutathione lyase family enzyme